MYYLTVSVRQAFYRSVAGWFYLTVFHKVGRCCSHPKAYLRLGDPLPKCLTHMTFARKPQFLADCWQDTSVSLQVDFCVSSWCSRWLSPEQVSQERASLSWPFMKSQTIMYVYYVSFIRSESLSPTYTQREKIKFPLLKRRSTKDFADICLNHHSKLPNFFFFCQCDR